MYSVEYNSLELIPNKWDVAFIGSHEDDRDIAIKNFLENSSSKIHSVQYENENMELIVDNNKNQLHEKIDALYNLKGKKIVIDATSMSVAELYIISKLLYNNNHSDFDVIYAEPEEYTKNKDHFNLSDSGLGFSSAGIPSLSTPEGERRHFIFLLGYEGDRFSDAMESLSIEPEEVTIFFGIPSYKFDWEKNSYSNNIKVIADNQLNDRFIFCGANNPVSVCREMKEIAKLNNKATISIIPIGTKPQAIGCIPSICGFNMSNPAELIWDHPVRKKGRTKGISSIIITKNIFE